MELLYVEAGSGKEMSYGRLAQGKNKVQETYPGHRWNIRECSSRELLQSIVARPTGGGPQLITVGSDGGIDPLKAAMWRVGQSPREPLLKACGVLLKVLQNIAQTPGEQKYRSLRVANPSIASTLDVPGSIALLTCAGFDQTIGPDDGEPRLVLAMSRPLALLKDVVAQLQRLREGPTDEA